MFEDYLKSEFMKDYLGTDDDAPDLYEHWVSGLEVSDVMDYQEKFTSELLAKLKEKVQKYTDPKPEFSGITWANILSNIKF